MNQNLGLKATCKITGFAGIAAGYVQYISGCNQYLIQARVKGEGANFESAWIDEERLDFEDGPQIVLDNRNRGFDKAPPAR